MDFGFVSRIKRLDAEYSCGFMEDIVVAFAYRFGVLKTGFRIKLRYSGKT
jgi:hypothetical protein